MALFDRIFYISLKHMYLNLDSVNVIRNETADNVMLFGLLFHDSFRIPFYGDRTLHQAIIGSRHFEGTQCLLLQLSIALEDLLALEEHVTASFETSGSDDPVTRGQMQKTGIISYIAAETSPPGTASSVLYPFRQCRRCLCWYSHRKVKPLLYPGILS